MVTVFSTYVVWYLFLAGAGAGCYAIASCWALADVRGRKVDFARLPCGCRLGFAAAPALLVLSSLFLFADLGSPERVWSVFLHPLDSVISAGACFVACLALLSSAVLAAGAAARVLSKGLMLLCWIGGALLSLGVMAYTGVLFSSMVSIDFWHTPLIPVLFVVSSLTTGVGVIVCLTVLAKGAPSGSLSFLRPAAIVGSLLEAIALAAFLIDRFCFSAVARMSCMMLFAGELAFPFWFGVVLLGFAVPLASHALYARLPFPGLALVSSAGVLAAGFSVRYCVVSAAVLPTAMLGSFL